MAIKLITTRKEYLFEYWKIVRVNFLVGGETQVTLGLFKDKESSKNIDNMIDAKNYSVIIPKDTYLTGDVFRDAYIEIKKDEQFVDASDV